MRQLFVRGKALVSVDVFWIQPASRGSFPAAVTTQRREQHSQGAQTATTEPCNVPPWGSGSDTQVGMGSPTGGMEDLGGTVGAMQWPDPFSHCKSEPELLHVFSMLQRGQKCKQEHNAHEPLSEFPQRLGSLCCEVFGWSLPSRQLKVHKLHVPTRLGALCCLFINALIPT